MATIHRDDVVLELPDYVSVADDSPSGYQLTRTGGFAQGFLKAGAGIFVSTLWSVVDEPARRFTEVFYGQLVSGHSVADAATVARQKCRADGDPTWLAYVVYGRPDGRVVRS